MRCPLAACLLALPPLGPQEQYFSACGAVALEGRGCAAHRQRHSNVGAAGQARPVGPLHLLHGRLAAALLRSSVVPQPSPLLGAWMGCLQKPSLSIEPLLHVFMPLFHGFKNMIEFTVEHDRGCTPALSLACPPSGHLTCLPLSVARPALPAVASPPWRAS